jgi:hypothetical protein
VYYRSGSESAGGGNTLDVASLQAAAKANARKLSSSYGECISEFYNSTDGQITQFSTPTTLIPGWNPNAPENLKNWIELLGTKSTTLALATRLSNAGQGVLYSLAAGTTTEPARLSVVESVAGRVGGTVAKTGAAVTTGRDIMAHASCGVSSFLPANIDLMDLLP